MVACIGVKPETLYAHSVLRTSFLSGAILPAVLYCQPLVPRQLQKHNSMISFKLKPNFNRNCALKAKIITQFQQVICPLSEENQSKAES